MTADEDRSDQPEDDPGRNRRIAPLWLVVVSLVIAVVATAVAVVALTRTDDPERAAPDPRAGWKPLLPDDGSRSPGRFVTGWKAFTDPPQNAYYYPVEYMKDDRGWVHVHGVVISDNAPAFQPIAPDVGPWASDMFILPKGYRPACTVPVPSIIGDLAGEDTKEGWVIARRDGTVFMARYGEPAMVDGQPVIQNTALMDFSFQADPKRCPTDRY